ncbi:TIR domain-containing protein [Sorangium cellulosum]|uniref:TIR domain-containing protein n=1 Tax=Sorangium cellulosum So0157-2 TaxID=1254432 RepID=S4XYP7_SORCE|nr:TIR domain-containing protein [Sorangium cellulosum]AGP37441.1 hypothetical protein SCE1572_24885 [Sorangium cellulosum So0157-2]
MNIVPLEEAAARPSMDAAPPTDSTKLHDVFLSYAPEDEPWACGELLACLDVAGLSCRHEATFALGVPRVLEFERAIQASRWTVLVISPAFRADREGPFIAALALTYDLDVAGGGVIPVIYRPVPVPPHLAALDPIDATSPKQREEALRKLGERLARRIPTRARKPPCPYPGMVPFTEAFEAVFHGRARELQALLERLEQTRLLTLIGPSGAGKSSLVFAGLAARLRREATWDLRIMRPGAAPGAELTARLEAPAVAGKRRLLIIDQLEEVFTLCTAEARASFFDALARVAADVRLLLVLRADFYSDLMRSPLWPVPFEDRIELAPLEGDALERAIEQPAIHVSAYVEPGLVNQLLADARDQAGALPFLQETMVRLWERMRGKVLTLDDYLALGVQGQSGLAVAVADRASAALELLDPQARRIARRTFLRLVQFGQGRPDTRRQLAIEALRASGDPDGLVESTVHYLASSRLLTVDSSPGAQIVDIAHEILLSAWPTLQAWIAEKRAMELTRRRLEARAAEWERLGRRGGLLGLVEVREAERYVRSADTGELGHSGALDQLVAASRRRLWLLAGLAVGAFIMIAVTAFIAIVNLTRARSLLVQNDVDTGRALSLQRPGDARLYFARAVSRAEGSVLRFWERPVDDLLARSWLVQYGQAPSPDIAWMPVTPTRIALMAGDLAVVSLMDGNALYVLDWTLGEPQVLLGTVRNRVELVTGALGQTVVAHDIVTAAIDVWRQLGELLTIQLPSHPTSVAIDPGEDVVAVALSSGGVRFYDVMTGLEKTEMAMANEHAADWIGFDPAAGRLAMFFRESGRVELLDSGAYSSPILEIRSEGGFWEMGGPVFSPQGHLLAVPDGRNGVAVIDVRGQPFVAAKFRHLEAISTAAFDPEGLRLLTASRDGTALVWDIGTQKRIGAPMRHGDVVLGARFLGEGRLAVTTCQDGNFRVWDTDYGELYRMPIQLDGIAWSTVVTQDGQFAITTGNDGKVRRHPLVLEDAERTFAVPKDARLFASALPNRVLLLTAEDVLVLHVVTGQIDRMRLASDGADVRKLTVDALGKSILVTEASEALRRIHVEDDGFRVESVHAPEVAKLSSVERDRGIWLAWANDGFEVEVDLESGRARALFPFFVDQPDGLFTLHSGITPSGRTAYALGQRRFVRWWTRTGERISDVSWAGVPVLFTRDEGRIVARVAATSNALQIFDASGARALSEPMPHAEEVSAATFFHDERLLLSASGRHVFEWDASTGAPVGLPRIFPEPVVALAETGSGRVAVLTDDGQLRVLNLGSASQPADDLRSAAEIGAARRIAESSGTEALMASEWRALRDGAR